MLPRILLIGMTLAQGVARADGQVEGLLDLTDASIWRAEPSDSGAWQPALLLREEVLRRSRVEWAIREGPAPDGRPLIVVGTRREVSDPLQRMGVELPTTDRGDRPEGFGIGTAQSEGRTLVWVVGADEAGTRFAVGKLLRSLRLERDRVTLPADFTAEEAPHRPIRGAQIGYRPKTNSYDAWDLDQWEQYLRDLAVFGCNAVELIPPRSDDEPDSPHFPLPQQRMLEEVSKLARRYGMKAWVWYPAMDEDYTDAATVEAAVQEWSEVLRHVEVDAVFVPGGDPGKAPPAALFDLLEKQAAALRQGHPDLQMWMSPQSFDAAEFDEFLALIREEPEWLTGIVHGPQVRVDLPELRELVPARYPIRDYPDVTHNRHCQFPVDDWDLALALTEGRESINPRPREMARLARRSVPHTIGSIVYSEGCQDDVNKVIWLAMGWNPDQEVDAVLREYGRYFIAAELGDRFAEGLVGLEQNWIGPLAKNEGVDEILAAFQRMEREASPRLRRNWRFLMALYRAHFDALERGRLRVAEFEARSVQLRLSDADSRGTLAAIEGAVRAIGAFESAVEFEEQLDEVNDRLNELAEALYQSIGLQLSVPKYGALTVDRGGNLDTALHPLNDSGFLLHEIGRIRVMEGEEQRLAALHALVHRTDPGPGGFYDDLGDPRNQPRLVRSATNEEDPSHYRNAFVGFGFRQAGPDRTRPRAWWHHAETCYDTPLEMKYDGLDPAAGYRVRVVYSMEWEPKPIRLVAEGTEIHAPLARPFELLDFEVPRVATADGTLTLTWTGPQGAGGNGRGCQVAEVWLIRADSTGPDEEKD